MTVSTRLLVIMILILIFGCVSLFFAFTKNEDLKKNLDGDKFNKTTYVIIGSLAISLSLITIIVLLIQKRKAKMGQYEKGSFKNKIYLNED